MSHSVFKEFPATDNNTGVRTGAPFIGRASGGSEGDNVVIVLNKDGSVSVDQNALHSFLRDDEGKTAVSVVRVQSPTPSLEAELREHGPTSSDEETNHSSNEHEFSADDSAGTPDENASDEESEHRSIDGEESQSEDSDRWTKGGKRNKGASSKQKRNRGVRERTPHVRLTVEQYLGPEEAKIFAAEILQYAGMTSDLTLDVDYDFQRFVVQNDHCYTPLVSPTQKDEAAVVQTPPSQQQQGGGISKRRQVKSKGPSETYPITNRPGKSQVVSRDEDIYVTNEEFSDDQLDEEEPQDDDDKDYSVSESENDRDSDLDFRVNNNYIAKKKKNVRKNSRPSLSTTSGSGRQRRDSVGTSGATGASKLSNQHQITPGSTTLRKLRQSISGSSNTPARASKIETSTEDRQSKLSYKAASQQPAKPHVSGIVNAQPIATATPKKDKNVKQTTLFKDIGSLFSTPDIIKKVGGGGVNHQIDGGTNIFGGLAESGGSQQAQEILPSFDMELMNSLVGVDEMSAKGDVTALDTSILDSIAGEDGLPEELLQHVAELVENKSLQEVIDKQVLGVEDPMAHLTGLLPKPSPSSLQVHQVVHANPSPVPMHQVKKESPFVKLAQQKQLAKQSAAAAASLTAPRKEPIKIVRSDGRVITLPPIEAPTTRAKRRAQNIDSGPPPKQQIIVAEETGVAVPQMVEILATPPPVPSAAPVQTRKKSGSDRGSTSRRASTAASVAESDMDDMWNSEDDPDRLWCICKQPHNNRFMICCDTCEDWFHGKCVNITKQMGQQMEAAGKEWTCPNCLQGLKGNQQVCVVCTRLAKPNSIYCGDECIIKHSKQAQNSSQQKVLAGLPVVAVMPQPEVKKIGIIKTKMGHVIVYNRLTQEYLSDESAPTLPNIKEWLSQNPDYELVQPGTEVALAFKAKQAQLQQLNRDMSLNKHAHQVDTPDRIQSKLKLTGNKQVVIVHPKTAQQIKVAPSGKSSPVTDKSTRIKVRKSTGEQPTTSMGERKVQRGEVEPIRLNVRKTFKEQLALRMLECVDGSAKLTGEEIEKFSLETEQEMFALFNRDTGQKYKAKYRSLMFNIKDRKNETLFQKICEKAVKPFRLVRMTPEELASQELAKWRENENKHQLDMIKKSEMDLLACAKNYVLKSHKGEEVIENMIVDREIETVDVTMLSGLEKDSAGTQLMGVPSKSSPQDVRKDKKRERSRDRDRHRHHSSSKHHKRKRSRDKDRYREKERERERHGSSSGIKHKSSAATSSHSSSHHSSTRDTKGTSSSSSKKEASRHRDKVQSIKEESNHSSSPASTTSSSNNKSAGESSSTQVYKPSKKETEESYDLIGKILQGTSPELVAKLQEMEKQKSIDVKESNKMNVVKREGVANVAATADQEYNPETTDLMRPESAPVPQKVVWRGSISHADIAEVHAFANSVYGEIDDVKKDLPKLFNICGRIEPDAVWDYLGKIKKSPNRDLAIMRFEAQSTEEQGKYENLYSYLQSKGRLAVVKLPSPIIKDFYLVPLRKGKQLPSVLLTLRGLANYESRSNCLLGIVVKTNLKRPAVSSSSSSNVGTASKVPKVIPQTSSTEDHAMSSSSATRPKVLVNKLTVGLPKLLPTVKKDDDDEPYSPGGSDNEESTATPMVAPPPPAVDSQDLQKEVERLNRQIEASKNEIVEMLSKDPLEEEAYSPSRPVSPSDGGNKEKLPAIPLANISIPSNLHEILATLQNAGSTRAAIAPMDDEEDDYEEYNPVPVSSNQPAASSSSSDAKYKPRPASPSTRAFLLAQQQQAEEIPFITGSKLSNMTDAELMSLVPDGVDLQPVLPMPPGLDGGKDEEYDPNE